MKTIGAFFVLLAATFCCANLQDEWEAFKIENNLSYDSPKEEALRRALFAKALHKVNEHNKKYYDGSSPTKMQMHIMALLTDEEFAKEKTGFKHDPKEAVDVQVEALPTVTANPPSIDWRTTGAVTAVQNQKSCGSCWAFSAVGALEGQTFIKYNKLVNASEQQLVDCGTAVKPNELLGCNGGMMQAAFDYVRINGGIDTEASYPYTAVGGTCKFNTANICATCTGYVNVASDVNSVMTAVATKGPLSVAIGVTNSAGLYKLGLFNSTMCTTSLNHGVLLVGYGTDASGNDYWLMKNSWGTSWGMAGYFQYPRSSSTCVIGYLSYPLV